MIVAEQTLLHFLHRDRPPFDERDAFLTEFDSVEGEETIKARGREPLHLILVTILVGG